MLGTEFSLMEKLFPDRNRQTLKSEFKSEEKKNLALINEILAHQIKFDSSQFNDADFGKIHSLF